ncbi:MAG: metallophosphoesterase [Planctomycetota bacterium]|nr:metallophosphoesterase [Planctomycetota bacterium]
MPPQNPIPALLARGPGHQFVVYGDCCSGIPGTPFEANFAAVNAALRRIDPQPEFILFAGDHIQGMTDDAPTLRSQWRHFFEREMAWLDRKAVPFYSATSNHNTCNAVSEAVWREVFTDLPRNGPPEQQGLSYWVRRGDLLVVVANTSFTGLGGQAHVECAWLDRVLAENADARHKLVMGHHPIWPVNGYTEAPGWCIERGQGQAMWRVLVARGVTAYLCSHIIAFDAQEHGGILQLTTGGAGTSYGPGGFMDGPAEYHHFVQAALDGQGLRCQTIDPQGRARERVEWRPGAGLVQGVVDGDA